jgi:hypothetical protein
MAGMIFSFELLTHSLDANWIAALFLYLLVIGAFIASMQLAGVSGFPNRSIGTILCLSSSLIATGLFFMIGALPSLFGLFVINFGMLGAYIGLRFLIIGMYMRRSEPEWKANAFLEDLIWTDSREWK